jgi:hypothetical protein
MFAESTTNSGKLLSKVVKIGSYLNVVVAASWYGFFSAKEIRDALLSNLLVELDNHLELRDNFVEFPFSTWICST